MRDAWETIRFDSSDTLARVPAQSRSVVLISSGFEPEDQARNPAAQPLELSPDSLELLSESFRVLGDGGLLFVYGLPRELAFWGQHLGQIDDDAFALVFKYWIVLDLDDAPRDGWLKAAHLGLLMFCKSRVDRPSSFHLNTKLVRAPHAFCSACGLNVKDWGGKKHLMNPNGAALSDVWRDLPRIPITDSVTPGDVMDRIQALTTHEAASHLHVVQRARGVQSARRSPRPRAAIVDGASVPETFRALERDAVHLDDCVSYLKRVEALHPEGVFDLAFADPPYNLKKSYDSYADALAEQHYLEWCDAWLEGMARTLKPGGTLFVLNLPKWAMHHAAFLNRHLEFRNWIVWDALSDPRGKLMPAHYALLYYTKRGAKPVFNYAALDEQRSSRSVSLLPAFGPDCRKAGPQTEVVLPPDAPKYCLRAACLKQRKAQGNDDKVELSDVWFDIHRIKHKRDRDAHPCQLPEKLMERIIKLTTHRGGLVFDPFCGAGTTAITAAKLGRHFVVTDLDENYVRITREKLAAMQRSADLFGDLIVPRISTLRPKRSASKRDIEVYLQGLARKLGRVPGESDVAADKPDVLRQIDQIYPARGAAFKRCKVALAE